MSPLATNKTAALHESERRAYVVQALREFIAAFEADPQAEIICFLISSRGGELQMQQATAVRHPDIIPAAIEWLEECRSAAVAAQETKGSA